jgi:uncharacterized protein
MRSVLIACLSLALVRPCLAQTADTDPATKDDIILYLQTMHTHDLIHRVMEVQSKTMQQAVHDQLAKQKELPADFEPRMNKMMDEMYKSLPWDDMMQAMIPAYQNHFTHGDIMAMNAFYSSPVGQKVLEELPAVMQEGMQQIMPLLSKWVDQWKGRMQQEFSQKSTAATGGPAQR